MNRDRAFSAIIHEGKIAMVYHDSYPLSHWTLPGGGVENGENLEEAAIREALEEVNLKINVIRFLYKDNWERGFEYCFLAEPIDFENFKTGYDPELDSRNQIIKNAEWKDIIEMKDDLQVKQVLRELTLEEKIKYKIKNT